MGSRGRNPEFSDDSASSITAEEGVRSDEEHDLDKNTSTDSRMLYCFPSWSVTGRRGRKAKEPTVSKSGLDHVRNSNEAETKDSNSTTIKGMSIKGLEIKNGSGSLEQENMNLDLCLGIATESGVGKAGDEKAYACKFCGRSFAKYEALGGHIRCHLPRKPKSAKDGQAKGSHRKTAGGDRDEGSTGQRLGGRKRARYEGSLGTSSSKTAKGCSSPGTAACEACDVSSSESIIGKAPVAASSSRSAVLGIDLNEIPPDEE